MEWTMDLNTLFAQNDWIFFAARAGMLAVALLCFALALGSWRRAGARDMQKLFAETQALTELSRSLAAHLRALEARLDDQRELAAAADPGNRGYELALKMARNGMQAEDIVKASGVTRHEAQLLAQLHNPPRP
jgi:hypothetical protein